MGNKTPTKPNIDANKPVTSTGDDESFFCGPRNPRHHNLAQKSEQIVIPKQTKEAILKSNLSEFQGITIDSQQEEGESQETHQRHHQRQLSNKKIFRIVSQIIGEQNMTPQARSNLKKIVSNVISEPKSKSQHQHHKEAPTKNNKVQTNPQNQKLNLMHRNMIENLVHKYEKTVDMHSEIPENQMSQLQNEIHIIKMQSSKNILEE